MRIAARHSGQQMVDESPAKCDEHVWVCWLLSVWLTISDCFLVIDSGNPKFKKRGGTGVNSSRESWGILQLAASATKPLVQKACLWRQWTRCRWQGQFLQLVQCRPQFGVCPRSWNASEVGNPWESSFCGPWGQARTFCGCRCEICYVEEASGTLQEIVYNYFSQEIEGLQQIHSGMKLHRFFVSLLPGQSR